jgi:arsenite-transporting ATPase
VGIAALQQLLSASAPLSDVQTPAPAPLPVDAPDLASLVDELAVDQHGLIMLMGKGGVGKTTLAAAVAVELAQRGFPVHLTTSDPAAHLMETVLGAQNNLTVSRIDPRVETDRYRQEILAAKGQALDAQGRAMLEEDLRSPCTEEIAVFQAFSRVIREAGKKFVVMDTAPTGHTLLLLDATGAYHREVTRQMDSKGLHFTTPMMQLQDPKQTKVLIVTLAEQTPVLEAANLQADLRRAGIEPWAWLINNSLMLTANRSTLLQQRAANEQQFMHQVTGQYAKRWAVVPLQAEEPIGIVKLQQLCRHADQTAQYTLRT